MFGGDRDKETICAASTPQGFGGVSLVRMSGPNSVAIARKLCPFLPETLASHRCYVGFLVSRKEQRDLDEAVVTYFKEGKSYTGEETIEISCHGNPTLVSEILQELCTNGARAADRGEFTYRAFMNGRMDLVQAEGVLALIESQGQQMAKQALKQLKGGLSKALSEIESQVVWCLAHLEAGIDFSQEGLELVAKGELLQKLEQIKAEIFKLVRSFDQGRILNEGFHVSLVGVPNVGKSSLFNLMLNEDRAIVTDIPGTTRDLIEEALRIKGISVKLADTAGLRETSDQVEKLGVQRSQKSLKDADLVFFVFDCSRDLNKEEQEILRDIPSDKLVMVGNKLDLVGRHTAGDLKAKFPNAVFGSAQDAGFRDQLVSLIEKRLETIRFEDQALVLQSRHFENLSAALGNVEQSISLLKAEASAEFLAIEMKEALMRVQETLGKRFDDQILDRIFKEFCIGK